MWPTEQQDKIIVVREMRGSPVWNVQLFPVVQNVLMGVHGEYFKQLDLWERAMMTTTVSAATAAGAGSSNSNDISGSTGTGVSLGGSAGNGTGVMSGNGEVNANTNNGNSGLMIPGIPNVARLYNEMLRLDLSRRIADPVMGVGLGALNGNGNGGGGMGSSGVFAFNGGNEKEKDKEGEEKEAGEIPSGVEVGMDVDMKVD
jgi:hypothetical protein